MRFRYYFIALALAAGGFVIGGLLIPRSGEMALIYYRAGQYSTAMSILEKELESEELTPSNVHYGALTYLKLGDVEKAARLVERYIAKHPRDIAARRLLGRLYHEAGKPSLYLHNLERLEAAAPSARTRIRLKDAYWDRGMYGRWKAMLRRLVHDGDGVPADYVALARLEASEGHKPKALDYLAALRKRTPGAFGLNELTLMTVLYLDTDQPERAVTTVTRWLEAKPDIQAALDLAFQFQRRGRTGAALRILEPFVDKAPETPKLLRSLTDLEIAAGNAARAQSRLAALDARQRLSDSQMDLLISAALVNRDWRVAKAAFAKASLSGLPRELILRVLNEAASREDQDFAKHLSARVDERFRRDNPVAAARLALLIGDREAAARWAQYARKQATLGADDRLNLVTVLIELGQEQQAEAQLRLISTAGGVPDYQLVRLAVLLRKFGMVDSGKRLFGNLESTPQSVWLTAASNLLVTEDKPGPDAFKWLDALGTAGRTARDLLSAIYGAAYDLKLYRLAAETATRLVAIDDTLPNRIRQARALALAGEAQRAFDILKPLIEHNPEARQAYAEAVVGALKAGSMRAGTANAFLRGYLSDESIPLAQRKYLVYDLMAMKAFDVVVPVTAALAKAHPAEFEKLRYEALLAAGDKARFAREIGAAIARAKRPEQLKMLGALAFQETQLQVAKKAYAKILAAHPDDPAALRHLGLIAAWTNDIQTARRLLTRYLATGADDVRADFALAEVISRFPDWQKADPYYQKAIREVDAMKAPTLDDLQMRARALHRTGRFDAAIKAYESLIGKYPRNRKLFNEYVDFLYEIGRYAYARKVLQRN